MNTNEESKVFWNKSALEKWNTKMKFPEKKDKSNSYNPYGNAYNNGFNDAIDACKKAYEEAYGGEQ
jgi:hypothetical protein